jgi:hypothetical protein
MNRFYILTKGSQQPDYYSPQKLSAQTPHQKGSQQLD